MDGWKGKIIVSLRRLARETRTLLEDPRNYLQPKTRYINTLKRKSY